MKSPGRKTHDGFGVMGVILVIAVIGLLTGGMWLFLQRSSNGQRPSEHAIGSFGACMAHPESKVLQSYPETCVTKDGRQFTKPGQADTPDATKSAFLEIKEWQIKVPLSEATRSAVYHIGAQETGRVSLSLKEAEGTMCAANPYGPAYIRRFTDKDRYPDHPAEPNRGKTYVSVYPEAHKVGNFYYVYEDGPACPDPALVASVQKEFRAAVARIESL